MFRDAIDRWRVIRAEFEDYREAAYAVAADATNGKLLNARGIAAGVDTWSLFIGPEQRALAYASEELVDHWRVHPRLTYAAFERQRINDINAERDAYLEELVS